MEANPLVMSHLAVIAWRPIEGSALTHCTAGLILDTVDRYVTDLALRTGLEQQLVARQRLEEVQRLYLETG